MKRIYHTYDKWECYPAGFYEGRPKEPKTDAECEAIYTELLRDLPAFKRALRGVTSDWKKSCEHYLSNEKMNRIAWLGQAALCYSKGIPSCFRGGFNMLTEAEQSAANDAALEALNTWLLCQMEPPVTLDGAGIKAKADLY